MHFERQAMTDDFLPYGKQTITQADLDAVARALQQPLLTTGPLVGEFETAFASRVGAGEAVACSNGTAALHLAAMALGLGPDDVVLAPTQSFMASANGPHYTGAKIVFMDCDPDTGLVIRETFLAALERAGGKASAAVIVHLNGEMADMAAIAAEAQPRGIRLIEDACHAIGTLFKRDRTIRSMQKPTSLPVALTLTKPRSASPQPVYHDKSFAKVRRQVVGQIAYRYGHDTSPVRFSLRRQCVSRLVGHRRLRGSTIVGTEWL